MACVLREYWYDSNTSFKLAVESVFIPRRSRQTNLSANPVNVTTHTTLYVECDSCVFNMGFAGDTRKRPIVQEQLEMCQTYYISRKMAWLPLKCAVVYNDNNNTHMYSADLVGS